MVSSSYINVFCFQMKLLVLGALGGRLDHEFANLNSLYLFRKLRVILLSDESMTFLLPKGHKHEIKINPSLEGPYCGLLPLSGSSLCTTTSGLKWDLGTYTHTVSPYI
jgi:thiamine pyrophosphokinase